MLELVRAIGDSGCAKLGAVLHLGAGACRELDEYRRLNAAKLLLVEAEPEAARALESQLAGQAEARVVAAAVAAADGRALFRVLNNARDSSLHKPAALLEHAPNLALAAELTVPAITLGRLLDQLGADAAAENLLVVELQGAELSVLGSVAPAALRRFAWIALRASAEPLYEGGARLQEVDALLRGAGFRLVPRWQDESAWPFQDALYRRDERLIELEGAEQKARVLDEKARALDEKLAALEAAKAELERQTSARLEAEARALRETQAQREDLALELRRAQREAERLQAALAEAQAAREQVAKTEAQLRKDLREARQSSALSMKLQALREADLRDLQERYHQALSSQEKQRELLLKLGERLSIASGYFRELAEGRAALPAAAPEEPPRTPRARRKRARPGGQA